MAQVNYALVIVMLVVVGQVNCGLPSGFERCDDSGAVVQNFDVGGCSEGAPCKFSRGLPVGFKIEFASTTSYNNIDMHVNVKNDKYALRKCSRCPGRKGMMESFTSSFYLGDYENALESDTMEFYLTDDSQDRLVCIRFPMQISGGKKASDFKDHIRGNFELRGPGGKQIPKKLADKLVGYQLMLTL